MVITLTKDMSKEEIQKKLAEMKSTQYLSKLNLEDIPKKLEKKFDIAKHFGKLKWDEDPVAYQRRLRDE